MGVRAGAAAVEGGEGRRACSDGGERAAEALGGVLSVGSSVADGSAARERSRVLLLSRVRRAVARVATAESGRGEALGGVLQRRFVGGGWQGGARASRVGVAVAGAGLGGVVQRRRGAGDGRDSPSARALLATEGGKAAARVATADSSGGRRGRCAAASIRRRRIGGQARGAWRGPLFRRRSAGERQAQQSRSEHGSYSRATLWPRGQGLARAAIQEAERGRAPGPAKQAGGVPRGVSRAALGLQPTGGWSGC